MLKTDPDWSKLSLTDFWDSGSFLSILSWVKVCCISLRSWLTLNSFMLSWAEEQTVLSTELFTRDSTRVTPPDTQSLSPNWLRLLTLMRRRRRSFASLETSSMTKDFLSFQSWRFAPSSSQTLLEPESLRPEEPVTLSINWPRSPQPELTPGCWELQEEEKLWDTGEEPQVSQVTQLPHTSERDPTEDRRESTSAGNLNLIIGLHWLDSWWFASSIKACVHLYFTLKRAS